MNPNNLSRLSIVLSLSTEGEQILSPNPLPLVVGFLIQNFISSQGTFHRRGLLHSHRACKNFRAFSLVQYSTTKYLFIKFSKCFPRRKIFVCHGVYYMGHCSMDGKLILSCRPTPNDCLSPVPRRVLESQVAPLLGGKEPRID